MNVTLIPSVMISLFLFFIILGFVFGWIRGLSKSLTRFIIVLVVGVLSFFVIPPLSKAVLNMDISNFNITIGEVHVLTLQDLITDSLRQIPVIEDIIEASPTFETFLEVVPQMFVNVVLFIVFFFILKWVSMIIYWIIAGVCFSKKKTEGKEKHPFIGAVIGAVQGLIVVFVLMVPCYGVVEMIKPFEIAEENSGKAKTAIETVYNAVESNNETENEGEEIVQVVDNVVKYSYAVEENWVGKMFKFFGIQKLSANMFETLTTVEGKDAKFSLMEETKTLAKAYPYAQSLLKEGLDIEDNESLEDVQSILDELYKSKLLSGMVKEIVPEASRIWSSGGKFCGISKPTFDEESYNRVFNMLLLNLSVAEGDTVKHDIDTSVDLLMILNDAKVLKTLSDDGNILDILRKPENEDLIANMLSKALESSTIRAILPEIINVGMDVIYDALNIDKTTIDDITISSDDVDWDLEKPKLQTVFTNIFKIYDKIDIGKQQGQTTLESLDFKLLGETFDNIRFSQLLGPSSKQIMKALLNSEEIVGSDNETLNKFIEKLEEKWDSDEELAPTFESLGKALKIAREMQNNAEDFKVEDLGDVLKDLATNDTLVDIVEEVIEVETLKKLGLDDSAAGVVNETVSKVLELEGESLTKGVEAVEQVFSVANKVLNNNSENPESKVTIDETDSASLVGALAQSTEVLDVITKADSAVGDLNISENLSDEAKQNLKAEIKNLEADEEIKNKLKDLFGINE